MTVPEEFIRLGDIVAAARLTERLRDHLGRARGVRLGDTGVISNFVHLTNPAAPGVVRVLTKADAGRVFYRRRERGRILHLDIFHEIAYVDHTAVAEALKRAGAAFGRPALLDRVDLQTATGGGRVTGSLNYGLKPTLRRAHLSHVHLAMLLTEEEYPFVFYCLLAVEREILAQGWELRAVEAVVHDASEGRTADLTPYSTPSDSLLRGEGGQPKGHGPMPPEDLWEIVQDPDTLNQVYSLVEDNLTAEMDQLAVDDSAAGGELREVIRKLKDRGYLELRGGQYQLTERGRDLVEYLLNYRREVEMALRKMIRRLPPLTTARPRASSGVRGKRRRCLRSRTVEAAEKGAWLGDLAWPETVVEAMARRRRGRFSLRREDIRVYGGRGPVRVDICLLLDASASMAGERIRAAKHLARHLLFTGPQKVAVVAFQEREVKVYVPFTRSAALLDEGLRAIRPFGLTPLAEGLWRCCELISSSRTRNALLLLITDGVPTVPKWSVNPIEDALEAGRELSRRKVNFTCIGLEPNRQFLRQLSDRAGGRLYIVDELEKDTLVAIAHREWTGLLDQSPRKAGSRP